MSRSDQKEESINIGLSEIEQQALSVIKYHQNISKNLDTNYDESMKDVDDAMTEADSILKKYNLEHLTFTQENVPVPEQTDIVLSSWDDLVEESALNIDGDVTFDDVLSEKEINKVLNEYSALKEAFNSMHRLDGWDWTISGVAGIVAALVDIFLVQMPEHKGMLGSEGHEGGSLSNWMKDRMKNSMSPEEISKLERDNWVPYDPANNKNLNLNIDGLNTRTHRLQSLGHDPILGFVFGVKDILNGTFTAIDLNGKILTQAVDVSKHQDMLGMSIFNAIATVMGHLKSDIATPAGLPAPLMGLFQLIPGEIDGHTFTELSRYMYKSGYNFNHFLAMSVPVMMIEVLVRVFYFIKRHYKDGFSIKESIPFGQAPKLQTMLFSAHSLATAANAGKVYLQANPLAINYPQWVTFFKYSISQLKWILIDKPNQRFKYVQDGIDNDWMSINDDLNSIISDYNIKPYILK